MSRRRPPVALPVIFFGYKPSLWCRADVRLWHCCYLFSLQALYVVSLRRPTVACFIYFNFFKASLQTLDQSTLPLSSDFSFPVYDEWPACVHQELYFHDWLSDPKLFQCVIITCYIIPVFMMFASTFKRTHWFSPGYCLGQITYLERSMMTETPQSRHWR